MTKQKPIHPVKMYDIAREPRYFEKTQDETGREIPNPLSMVASVDMKPLTIGERIDRYLRSPSNRELELSGYGYDDDDYDFDAPDDTPLSEYEDRTTDILVRAKARSEARNQKAADQKREENRTKLLELQKQLEDLQKASATPTAPPAPKAADAPPKG